MGSAAAGPPITPSAVMRPPALISDRSGRGRLLGTGRRVYSRGHLCHHRQHRNHGRQPQADARHQLERHLSCEIFFRHLQIRHSFITAHCTRLDPLFGQGHLVAIGKLLDQFLVLFDGLGLFAEDLEAAAGLVRGVGLPLGIAIAVDSP